MKKIFLVTILMFSSLVLAAAKKLTVKIDGMTCPSCAASVESQFKKLPEVDEIDISIRKGTATVTLKEGRELKVERINEAVKDSGFTVLSVSPGS